MEKNPRGSRERQFNKAKAKAAHGSKGKQTIYSLLPLSRRCPATSREAGLQYAQRLLRKTSVVLTNAPHPSSFLLAFMAEQTSYGMEGPFGQFGSAVLAVSPPRILPTPSLLGERGGMLERQPCCCASTAQQQPKHWCVSNIFLATNTKHSTMRAAIGKLIPSQPDPTQSPPLIPYDLRHARVPHNVMPLSCSLALSLPQPSHCI